MMNNNRLSALIILSSTILIIFAMLHHPSANVHTGSAGNLAANVSEIASLGKMVHGAIIFLLIVLLYAFLNFNEQLQARGLDPRAGIIAYFGSSIAFIIAAAINGFIYPSVAIEYANEAIGQQEIFLAISRLCGSANQFFAMLGTLLGAGAIGLWSISLIQLKGVTKIIGGSGILLTLITFSLVLMNNLRLNVNGMTMVMLGFCFWYIAVSILMWGNMFQKKVTN